MIRIGATNLTHAVIMYGETAGPALTITTILRDYRCANCGGVLERQPEVHDDVIIAYQITCPHCAVTAPDIIHVEQLQRERIAYQQVLNGLPEHLRQALTGKDDDGESAAVATLLYP